MTPTLPPLTEAAFLRQVLELAALLGWHGAHFRAALTARGWRTPVQGSIGAGFVDVVLVSAARRRVLFVELKSDTGRPSPDQVFVGELLVAAGAEYRLWRPRDWDAIVEDLSR